jgi:integrase
VQLSGSGDATVVAAISAGTSISYTFHLRAVSGTLPKSEVTVGQAATRWMETYVRTQRTEKGQRIVAQRVRDYLGPFMGSTLVERVQGQDVREYRLWLERTTKLNVGTVWHVLSDRRCLLNWCEDVGLVERSPFPRRIMPKLQERPPDRVTDEEAERMRSLAEPYGFVCRLALGTGLRWGELCRAQAADVERGFLLVHQTKSRKVRRVPLAPDLLAEVGTRVGRLVPFAEVSPGSFAKAVRRYARMTRFHVHMMRHTFACQWMDRGGNLGALQQVIQHRTGLLVQPGVWLVEQHHLRIVEHGAPDGQALLHPSRELPHQVPPPRFQPDRPQRLVHAASILVDLEEAEVGTRRLGIVLRHRQRGPIARFCLCVLLSPQQHCPEIGPVPVGLTPFCDLAQAVHALLNPPLCDHQKPSTAPRPVGVAETVGNLVAQLDGLVMPLLPAQELGGTHPCAFQRLLQVRLAGQRFRAHPAQTVHDAQQGFCTLFQVT